MRLDLSSLVAMKSLIEDKISEETVRAQQEDVEHVTTAVSLREGIDSDDDATDDASPPISPESTTTTGSASDDSVLFNERPAVSDHRRGSAFVCVFVCLSLSLAPGQMKSTVCCIILSH